MYRFLAGRTSFSADTAVKDDSDKPGLLQLLLRRDVSGDDRYPELSKAMKYFKQTEGGCSEVCKTVEDYARDYARDYAMRERLNAIRNMIELGLTKEQILRKYSEKEYEKAEQELPVHA